MHTANIIDLRGQIGELKAQLTKYCINIQIENN